MIAIIIPDMNKNYIFHGYRPEIRHFSLPTRQQLKKSIKIRQLKLFDYHPVIVLNDFYKPKPEYRSDENHETSPQFFRMRKICGKNSAQLDIIYLPYSTF
jgi:hypothetical protein